MTDAIDLAESLTLPAEGLALGLGPGLGLAPKVVKSRAQQLRGRCRGWEPVRLRQARPLRCCRTLVLVHRPSLLREAES